MNKTFDALVVIGRFQLPHLEHIRLLRRALELVDQPIVVLGSSHRSRDTRNPFSADERMAMLRVSLQVDEARRLRIVAVRDYHDVERWRREVVASVHALLGGRCDDARIALLGHHQDASSADLDDFSQWQRIAFERRRDVDATSLRAAYFTTGRTEGGLLALSAHVAPGALDCLRAWSMLPAYERMAEEHAAVVRYRQDWPAPWHVTADALVTVADEAGRAHALLVRRSSPIGRGLWAVPGGFVDPGEALFDAAVRELKEETGLGMLAQQLRHALKAQRAFAHPHRSMRGRILTEAFHFDFPAPQRLPELTPSDETPELRWVPVGDLPLMEDQLFEDHLLILDHFLRVLDA